MPITPRKLQNILKKEGFIYTRQSGSHAIYKHPETKQRVTLPMHSKDIPKGTPNAILKDAGLKGKIKI